MRRGTSQLLVICWVVVALGVATTTNALRADPTEDTELDLLLSQADAAQKGDFTWDHPKQQYSQPKGAVSVSYDAYLKKAQSNAAHKREIEKLHELHKEQNVIPVTFDIFSKYDADHDGDLDYKEFMNMVEFINAGGLGNKFRGVSNTQTKYHVLINSANTVSEPVYITFYGHAGLPSKEVLLSSSGFRTGVTTLTVTTSDVLFVSKVRLRLKNAINKNKAWLVERVAVQVNGRRTESHGVPVSVWHNMPVDQFPNEQRLDDDLAKQAQGSVVDAWTKTHYALYQQKAAEFRKWLHVHMKEQRIHNRLAFFIARKKAQAEAAAKRHAKLVHQLQHPAAVSKGANTPTPRPIVTITEQKGHAHVAPHVAVVKGTPVKATPSSTQAPAPAAKPVATQSAAEIKAQEAAKAKAAAEEAARRKQAAEEHAKRVAAQHKAEESVKAEAKKQAADRAKAAKLAEEHTKAQEKAKAAAEKAAAEKAAADAKTTLAQEAKTQAADAAAAAQKQADANHHANHEARVAARDAISQSALNGLLKQTEQTTSSLGAGDNGLSVGQGKELTPTQMIANQNVILQQEQQPAISVASVVSKEEAAAKNKKTVPLVKGISNSRLGIKDPNLIPTTHVPLNTEKHMIAQHTPGMYWGGGVVPGDNTDAQ